MENLFVRRFAAGLMTVSLIIGLLVPPSLTPSSQAATSSDKRKSRKLKKENRRLKKENRLLRFQIGVLSTEAPFITLVTVGNPGNPADSNAAGSVSSVFKIGKYEVTNAQYAAFLNAVAKSDPKNLYDDRMGTDNYGGIARRGSDGSYRYETRAFKADVPVVFVTFWDAVRFCNWLHNGKPTGPQGADTTENGAYDLTVAGAIDMNGASRKPGAMYFLPDRNEWYKAAYHQPAAQGGDPSHFWDFPTRSNDTPAHGGPPGGTNAANWGSGAGGGPVDVGSYGNSPGHYGTFDMGGNVSEWSEHKSATLRALKGGGWMDASGTMQSSQNASADPATANNQMGFRVGSR